MCVTDVSGRGAINASSKHRDPLYHGLLESNNLAVRGRGEEDSCGERYISIDRRAKVAGALRHFKLAALSGRHRVYTGGRWPIRLIRLLVGYFFSGSKWSWNVDVELTSRKSVSQHPSARGTVGKTVDLSRGDKMTIAREPDFNGRVSASNRI